VADLFAHAAIFGAPRRCGVLLRGAELRDLPHCQIRTALPTRRLTAGLGIGFIV